MVQSLTLVAGEKSIPAEVFLDAYSQITISDVMSELTIRRVPECNCRECNACLEGIVKQHLKLESGDVSVVFGNKKIYGSASGCGLNQKLAVKAIIFEKLKQNLAERGVETTLNTDDVGEYELKTLQSYGLLKNN